MTLKEKIDFIIEQHKRVNQTYDNLPYYIHLQLAAEFAYKFIYLIPEKFRESVLIAVWGHDLIEDTGLTWNDVRKVLGELEADIIFALSNEKGKTRPERASDKYYNEMLENELYVFGKICDRLANMYYSYRFGNDNMFNTYKKEYPEFKKKLYSDRYKKMWDELDNIESTVMDEIIYPDIEKFDEDSVWSIYLPKPIPGSLFNELYSKGIIPKRKLGKNRYYYGKCRNASVALWNGYEFIYMRTKFNDKFVEEIKHLEDDDGFDLFIPLKEVEPKDDERIIY